jgi:hypothetical protein
LGGGGGKKEPAAFLEGRRNRERRMAGLGWGELARPHISGCVAPLPRAPHGLPRRIGAQLSVDGATSDGCVAPAASVAPMRGAPHKRVRWMK